MNSGNAKILNDISVSYGNVFVETNNKLYLDSSIISLKKAIKITPKNAQFYAGLTAAYCYFAQKDSAKKYLKITDKIDPMAINPAVRKIISSNK